MLIGICTNMLPKEPNTVGFEFAETVKRIGYEGGVTMEGFPVSKETFAKEAAATREFLAKYVK